MPESDTNTLFVKNDSPKPIIVNLSTYRDDQASPEDTDKLTFLPSTTRYDDNLEPGITPVDEERLRAARKDERVDQKFVDMTLQTVEERQALDKG